VSQAVEHGWLVRLRADARYSGMMMQELQRRDRSCTRCCSRNIATTLIASDGYERRCNMCGFTWSEPYLRLKPDRRSQPRQLLAKPIIKPTSARIPPPTSR